MLKKKKYTCSLLFVVCGTDETQKPYLLRASGASSTLFARTSCGSFQEGAATEGETPKQFTDSYMHSLRLSGPDHGRDLRCEIAYLWHIIVALQLLIQIYEVEQWSRYSVLTMTA